jgi:hypothetical protein
MMALRKREYNGKRKHEDVLSGELASEDTMGLS